MNWIKRIFEKSKPEIEQRSVKVENVEYIASHIMEDPIIEDMEWAMKKGVTVPVTVTGYSNGSFRVRAKSLFGILQLKNMPWKYANERWWKAIAPYMQHATFECVVYHVNMNRKLFFVRAIPNECNALPLKPDALYKGIVLEKTAHGIHFELGHNFLWKYGSIRGFIPIQRLATPSDYESLKAGDEKVISLHVCDNPQNLSIQDTQMIETHFKISNQNKSEEQQTIVEEKRERATKKDIKPTNASSDSNEPKGQHLVGTQQKVVVEDHEFNGRAFRMGDFECVLENKEEFYQDKQANVRKYLRSKSSGDSFYCSVLAWNDKQNKYVVKIADEIVNNL